MAEPIHVPVLADEILEALQPAAGHVVVDGTLGGGGHSRLLAERVGPTGLILGLDRDSDAIETAATSLSGLPLKLVAANFADTPEVLDQLEIDAVDGILLDLGLSSDQLAAEDRGFSFNSPGDFDLRFDRSTGDPAWKLLNRLNEKHLADLIYRYGQERNSRRIARKIVATRRIRTLRTANQVADLIRSVVPRSPHQRIDPATRTFQAFRIAVNDEFKWIEVALRRLPERLTTGGRIAVISFHSLEDKIVKQSFLNNLNLNVLNTKPIRATETEIDRNPRSRSARLRVAERI